jgi:hypothetical protein
MRRYKKQRNYTESAQQQAFFKALSFKYPWLAPYCFSIPNAGRRSPREGRRLVAEGLRAGVPDCAIMYPSNEKHALFLEFKSERGVIAKSQRDMIYRLNAIGYACYIVRSFVEALNRVDEYLLN